VEAGAEIDVLNKHSLSPLYLAILNNHTDCVKYMLQEGASSFFDGINMHKDRSPIFLAIRNENVEILRAIFASLNTEE
jgi:ankyrin repeat protein